MGALMAGMCADCTSKLSKLKNDKEQYEELKSKLTDITGKITGSILPAFQNSSNYLQNVRTSGDSFDNGKLAMCYKTINSQNEHYKGLLSDCVTKIADLEKQISSFHCTHLYEDTSTTSGRSKTTSSSSSGSTRRSGHQR